MSKQIFYSDVYVDNDKILEADKLFDSNSGNLFEMGLKDFINTIDGIKKYTYQVSKNLPFGRKSITGNYSNYTLAAASMTQSSYTDGTKLYLKLRYCPLDPSQNWVYTKSSSDNWRAIATTPTKNNTTSTKSIINLLTNEDIDTGIL